MTPAVVNQVNVTNTSNGDHEEKQDSVSYDANNAFTPVQLQTML